MEVLQHDVVIVGGGAVGLRAAIAAIETNDRLRVALISKVFTSLLVEDGRCVGVTAIDARSGALRAITAKTVILATGGAGRIFPFTTNAMICTGDGMAMAYRTDGTPRIEYKPLRITRWQPQERVY